MLKLPWSVFPAEYKFKVAIKNIGIAIGKLAVSLIAGSIGKDLAPQHLEAIGVAITVLAQTGLEALHDWARLKWPDKGL